MLTKDIYNILDKISPFDLQEKWDNSGLLIGDMQKEISKINLSLDLDFKLIQEAEENSLFIVHHPLIFSGIKEINFSKYPNNYIKTLIKKNISLIAMHTNFDKTHLNKYVFQEILGFKNMQSIDFICSADCDLSIQELIDLLKDKLQLKNIKIIYRKNRIKSISLTTGAGASLINEVKTDCFLTGDIKYHDAIKAESQKLMMIDIGHYESEIFFAEALSKELEKSFIPFNIKNSKNPFLEGISNKN